MKNMLKLVNGIKKNWGVESVILIGETKDVKVPYGELSWYNVRQKNFCLTNKLYKRIKYSLDNHMSMVYLNNENLYIALPGTRRFSLYNENFIETSTGIYHVEGHTWIKKQDFKEYASLNKLTRL